ncbi:DNA repair protein rad50 [Coemansia javaensis]|uniref:DNA repair protein RAD50 n=1 Tax=Coemansia javaensis TaxID=2761396 RepID=A0A9W8H6N3_9FUNG|nr:DNA repair protein rad50 [Coemansia javaensis]
MSVIRKLLIQGIRSFDPQNQEIIEFYAPLTIIVGQNGCGKTTIIECLKYVTTGELPPNSKGGAFIHDPKLVGENEVKAQVKLRFYNTSQRSMTCVRSMLLSQKKVATTQKTLEGALSFDATATQDKVSISSRCADLDAMLPEQLGVSKAVLENVIFCHQEESNWPLSEPALLKKRFDEIFAATRYTKALDSIKTIRKNQAVEIRVSRAELKHLEEKKAKAERVQAEYEKSARQIHEYRQRIDRIQQQETDVTAQIEALAGQLQEFMSLQTRIDGLQLSLEQKASTYEELRASTAAIDADSEELARMAADVARQIASQESDLQRKREERGTLQELIQHTQRRINEALAEIGRLRAAQESLKTKVAGRADAVAGICAQLGIAAQPDADAEQRAAGCAEAVESLLAQAENERGGVRQEARDGEQRLQAAIDATQSEIHAFANAASLCERQAAASEEEIRGLEQKRAALRVDEAQRQSLEDELAKETALLERARADNSEDAYREATKQKRAELADIGDAIARINLEISHNNRQADTRARLALEAKELEAKDSRFGELSGAAGLAGYTGAGGGPGSEAERTAAIAAAIAAKKEALAECAARAKDAYSLLSTTRTRLELAQKAQREQEQDIGEKRARIAQVCPVAEFDGAIGAARRELAELMEEAGQHKNVQSMYKAFIRKVESSHTCPVCHRGWDCAEDEAKVVTRLQLDYTKAPADLLEIEGEIRECQRRLDALAVLEPAVRDVAEWDGHAAKDLAAQIQELTVREQLASSTADDTDCEHVVLTTELDDMQTHLAQSQELGALEAARAELRAQVAALRHELQATGSTKTIDELQAEIERHQHRDATIRRELDRLAQEHELKQKEVGFRQDNIRALNDRRSDQARRASECDAIQQRITALESGIASSQAEGREARAKADALAPQLEERQARLAAFRDELREREAQIDQRARAVAQARDRLALMTSEIEQTRASLQCPLGAGDYPDRLAMAQAQSDKMVADVSAQQERLAGLDSALQESDRLAGKLAARQREIQDNIRLHANAADQKRLQGELAAARESQARLEAQLGQIYADADAEDAADEDDGDSRLGSRPRKRRHVGSDDEETAPAAPGRAGTRLQRRRNVLNARLSRLTGERAGLQGEVKQLEDQAQRLNRELSTDYRDVDQLYVRQLVQCKTEELASTDLETYGKALDAAIMQYHSLKMQDINKIIRELWINTYQGNDIDTIEIRSEVDGARNSRSHNYRVVMIKGGHAIDMRGRCSAGQKVLACLIIRLALAETFSANCGILALDEPTTNLDQENIDSLARSLARIIKSRQGQRNFQLIVITHDEIFMQLLGRSDFCDYYWRVCKDENQKSSLRRRPIAAG